MSTVKYDYMILDVIENDTLIKRYSYFDDLVFIKTKEESKEIQDQSEELTMIRTSFKYQKGFKDLAEIISRQALDNGASKVIVTYLKLEETGQEELILNLKSNSIEKKGNKALIKRFADTTQSNSVHPTSNSENIISLISSKLKTAEPLTPILKSALQSNTFEQVKYDEAHIYQNIVDDLNITLIETINNSKSDDEKSKIYTPNNYDLNNINQIKTIQLKEATNPDHLPDSNGITEIPIKQTVNLKNQEPIKTEGILTLTVRPPEKRIENENILLFPNDLYRDSVVKNVSGSGSILTKKDGRVFQGICTLIDAYLESPYIDPEEKRRILRTGRCEIPVTYQQIHRAMGYPTQRIGAKAKEEIKISVMRLATTLIFYDWTAERNARKIDLEEAIAIYGDKVMYPKARTNDQGEIVLIQPKAQYMAQVLECNLLFPNSKIDPKTGEPQLVDGFVIKEIPPLYVHAKLTKKIARIPLSWYEIKSFKGLTDRRTALISGLATRIQTLHYYKEKGDLKGGNYCKIDIDTLLKDNGIIYNSLPARAKIVNEIEAILDDFKSKKIIKNYTLLSKGKRPETIDIEI